MVVNDAWRSVVFKWSLDFNLRTSGSLHAQFQSQVLKHLVFLPGNIYFLMCTLHRGVAGRCFGFEPQGTVCAVSNNIAVYSNCSIMMFIKGQHQTSTSLTLFAMLRNRINQLDSCIFPQVYLISWSKPSLPYYKHLMLNIFGGTVIEELNIHEHVTLINLTVQIIFRIFPYPPVKIFLAIFTTTLVGIYFQNEHYYLHWLHLKTF